jgi:hypothetical protein
VASRFSRHCSAKILRGKIYQLLHTISFVAVSMAIRTFSRRFLAIPAASSSRTPPLSTSLQSTIGSVFLSSATFSENLAVSAASPAAATQFGSVPGFSPSAQSQRPAAAGLSRDGSNKATIAAFLAQQARSFEISLLRARKQEKIPDHRLENRETDGGRKEAQFPVVRQAMEKDIIDQRF